VESTPVQDEVIRLLPVRKGHLRLESGHHGDTWLDLELLCLRPEPVRRLAAQLAARLAGHDVEAVCGPLVEGAFVALWVAEELGVAFSYSERRPARAAGVLFPFDYRIPDVLRAELRGRRVAIVNDVTNAGSAVRGTLADLDACGAVPVAIGTLAVLGGLAASFAAEKRLPLETLASLPNTIWTPAQCTLCARGVALEPP
jgi:orotate phosphoribosyltransferase